MKVLQVHSVDLEGQIYNGYDLQKALNREGITARQIVYRKFSSDDEVILKSYPDYVRERLEYEENQLSVDNLLTPWEYFIKDSQEYAEADIVHYHMIHHHMMSLIDMPLFMNGKPSVWTIHDPWVITGHCVYPLNCDEWRNGCQKCKHTDWPFVMKHDRAYQQWKIKDVSYKKVNPEIVVSTNFMKNYMQESPLTAHFKNVHVIPFGLDKTYFLQFHRKQNDKIAIGFRLSDYPVKGCSYIYEMMNRLNDLKDRIIYICVGQGNIPEDIIRQYNIKCLGWEHEKEKITQFYSMCDIFLMPSLAESFGLMAIEAMAQGCCVVCFKETVLEEITDAPNVGCAVAYGESKDLADNVRRLINNEDEIRYRGKKGREHVKEKYNFDNYVKAHIDLYLRIMEKNRRGFYAE